MNHTELHPQGAEHHPFKLANSHQNLYRDACVLAQCHSKPPCLLAVQVKHMSGHPARKTFDSLHAKQTVLYRADGVRHLRLSRLHPPEQTGDPYHAKKPACLTNSTALLQDLPLVAVSTAWCPMQCCLAVQALRHAGASCLRLRFERMPSIGCCALQQCAVRRGPQTGHEACEFRSSLHLRRMRSMFGPAHA